MQGKSAGLPQAVAVVYDDLCRKKWAHAVAVGERNPDGSAAFDVEVEALVFDKVGFSFLGLTSLVRPVALFAGDA